jgi:hypothetical protein
MTKTWQFRQSALPRAFSGEKHALARSFYVKFERNYELSLFGAMTSFLAPFHLTWRHATSLGASSFGMALVPLA